MKAALETIYNALSADTALADLLATYRGLPTVFLGRAPSEAKMPFVALHVDSAIPEASHASDRMALAADVYDRAESAVKALEIADRIERLLDAKKLEFGGLTGLGVWRDFKGLVEEDDASVQHVHLEFVVRYGRNDLYP